MKFTLNWLKDHLDTTASLDEIEEALISLGIEVEEIINFSERLKPFTIAYIKSAEKHPNADKLRICRVETFDGLKQIVCGAPNARAGIYVVYAPIGTYIPGTDITLKSAEIRGVLSEGMMLSERELLISDEHDGIIEFDDGQIGDKASSYLGLDDVLFDISITPNRGDLLGVRGIAKDLAAISIGTLKPLKFQEVETKNSTDIKIEVHDKLSSKFCLQKITNVKNNQSPDWLKNRLNMIGIKPRSALVDITNYICFDLNQPMHCYDADKINNSKHLTIKYANKEEKYKALDDVEYILKENSPLICFADQKVALAGIKGSFCSMSELETKNIFLEAAHFDHVAVAFGKRALNINTDSAYRFEREIDVENIETVLKYASYLISTICGDTSTEFFTPAIFSSEPHSNILEMTLEYVNTLSGLNLTMDEVVDVLGKLDIKVIKINTDTIKLQPPRYRNYLKDKCDVVADIIRVKGVQNIKVLDMNFNVKSIEKVYQHDYERSILAKNILANMGFLETINMSFISSQEAQDFGIYLDDLVLSNPISEDMNIMRQSLVPSLFRNALNNISHFCKNLKIYEVANIYNSSEKYELVASALITGDKNPSNWLSSAEEYSIWDMKQYLFYLIKQVGFDANKFQIVQDDLPVYYHSGKSAALCMGKNVIAYFGEIHPRLSQQHDLKQPMFFLELFLDRLPQVKQKVLKQHLKIPNLMPVERDFSFIIDKKVRASEIIKLAKSADKKFISSVDVFDIYQGSNIPDDKKSVSIKVMIQAHDKTFVEKEINDICTKVIDAVIKGTGAIIRDK